MSGVGTNAKCKMQMLPARQRTMLYASGLAKRPSSEPQSLIMPCPCDQMI